MPARRARPPAASGQTRWTGLPRIVTCQVVTSKLVSEALPPIVYRIFHQPASVSPGAIGAPG